MSSSDLSSSEDEVVNRKQIESDEEENDVVEKDAEGDKNDDDKKSYDDIKEEEDKRSYDDESDNENDKRSYEDENDKRSYEDDENDEEEEREKQREDQENQNEKEVREDEEEISGPRLYADPDEEPEEEDVAPTLIDLEMAKCRAELGSEGALFVKFPNFLSVETKPFDVDTYEDEIEDDDVLDEEGRTRLKLKIENTIRWRLIKDPDGNEIKESNAKMVRWSDGTMSLYLGNEIFDVERQKIMDHNHLFIRQGAGLEAQSVFTDKLIFRPHSTETLTHRKVTLNMADKSSKIQKIKVLASVGDNPDQHKQLIRKEEERLRAKARREAQQRSNRDRPRQSGLSSSFLEDDDETSLSAIKRSYQSRMGGSQTDSYSRDQSIFGASDSDEEVPERSKRIGEAKLDSDNSGSDIESPRPQKTNKRRIIEEDDEDE